MKLCSFRPLHRYAMDGTIIYLEGHIWSPKYIESKTLIYCLQERIPCKQSILGFLSLTSKTPNRFESVLWVSCLSCEFGVLMLNETTQILAIFNSMIQLNICNKFPKQINKQGAMKFFLWVFNGFEVRKICLFPF